MSCGSSSLWNRIRGRRARSGSTSMRATTRCTVTRKGDSFTATTVATVICRCTSSAASICCVRGCANRIRMPRPQRSSSHRQAGPAIARLHLPHWPIVEPPGGGQGGVSVGGGESAVRGDPPLAAPGLGQAIVSEAILRARREGQSHQGAATRPLCRPHQRTHDAGEPVAVVLLLVRLRADAGVTSLCP